MNCTRILVFIYNEIKVGLKLFVTVDMISATGRLYSELSVLKNDPDAFSSVCNECVCVCAAPGVKEESGWYHVAPQ